MEKAKKIKLFLGLLYFLIIISFLLLIFSKFSISDFTNYEFIKSNTEYLNKFKNSNLLLVCISFILFTIVWVLMLGFGSPIFLVGGFLFGKWLGTLIVTFSLAVGATEGFYQSAQGFVSIYQYNGTSWNQVGQDIDGESPNDKSGISVSLSSDGNIVAIGSIENDRQLEHYMEI